MASTSATKQELELSIPWAEVEKETSRIVNQYRKKARIPGFRAGKVPPAVVRARFKSEIHQELLERLIPDCFWHQARDQNLRVVGSPNIADVEFEDGKPLSFRAEFEVMPEFELGEYRRLKIPFTVPEVSDEDVSAELQRFRERHVSYRNLDPRPLEDGDIAVLSLKSEAADDAPQIDQEETTMVIGEEGALPEFSENLRGKSPGDESAFDVSYPEDFGKAKLEGKTVKFHARVKGLREKELPELDDDFASDLGVESLEALKQQIREGIEQQRRHHTSEVAKEKIVDQLVANHDFPAPEKLIEQQVVRRVESRLRGLAQQGVDPNQLDVDWRKVAEEEREPAIRAVKAGVILERIAEVENIRATEQEIDEQIRRYAAQEKKSVSEVRGKLAEDGSLDRMQSHMRNEKTLAFLLDEAEKVDQDDTEDDEE